MAKTFLLFWYNIPRIKKFFIYNNENIYFRPQYIAADTPS